MDNDAKHRFFVFLLLAWFFLMPPSDLRSEFYRYTDRNGSICFVDDESSIPAEYRDDRKIYTDRFDHLSEGERSILLEKEQNELDLIRRQEDLWLTEQKKRQEEADRQEYLNNTTTQVTIRGNQVLVPVTLCYQGRKVKDLLVLDTGATITLVHQCLADSLACSRGKRIGMQVAGGGTINATLKKLDWIQVGPHRKENINIVVTNHEGSSVPHKGLLGMNFLRGLEYAIDFDSRIIRWKL